MAETGLLKPALKAIAEDIDKSFDLLLPVPGDPRDRLVEAMRYATIGGGKRVRPLLVCATAALFGVSREAAVRVGTAIEAIHVYSLIHDDLPCMDNDALRHGKPTVHLAFDDAAAVLAGDALHDFAFEVLSDPATSGDPFTRIELIRTLATASGMNGMCGGQMMDMAFEGKMPSLAEITRLQRMKTAALINFSCEAGAILGKASLPMRNALLAYGQELGLARVAQV